MFVLGKKGRCGMVKFTFQGGFNGYKTKSRVEKGQQEKRPVRTSGLWKDNESPDQDGSKGNERLTDSVKYFQDRIKAFLKIGELRGHFDLVLLFCCEHLVNEVSPCH